MYIYIYHICISASSIPVVSGIEFHSNVIALPDSYDDMRMVHNRVAIRVVMVTFVTMPQKDAIHGCYPIVIIVTIRMLEAM